MTGSFEALNNATSTREQIMNATMICIITLGPARTNISSVASQAGVSRPTVYAHFETLEDLIQESVSKGVGLLIGSIELHAANFETPRERLVEAFLRLLELADQVDVLRRPMSFEIPSSSRDRIPQEGIDAARKVLTNLLDGDLPDDKAADERAETAVRLFLSLAAYRRDDDVRGYIERVALPALGL